jgi:transmembrane sensor
MAEKFEEISELVIAHITNQLSEDQKKSLNAWAEESSANKVWLEQWNDIPWIANELDEYNKPDVDEGLRKTWALIEEAKSRPQLEPTPKPKLQPLWKDFGWAAAVIILFIGSWWGYNNFLYNKRSSTIAITDSIKKQIDSAKVEHITLSSMDQPQLVVDGLPNGLISSQAGVDVIKQDTILIFKTVRSDKAALNFIQTISTGRGKQLQIILPDGSKVWLNAASSIRFPLAYQSERWIETTGEIFVDVYPDKLLPFTVIARQIKVEALGTKFNVKSYDSITEVALLEGKIKIKNGNVDTTLSKSGVIALLNNDSTIKFTQADSKKVTAWRSGVFTFKKDSTTAALREIERWYAVKVRYINTPPTVISNTSFPRDFTLRKAINLLHQTDSNLTIIYQDSVLIVSYKKRQLNKPTLFFFRNPLP